MKFNTLSLSERMARAMKLIDARDKQYAAAIQAGRAVVATVWGEERVHARIYRTDTTASQPRGKQDYDVRRKWDGRCEIVGVFSPVFAVAGMVADYMTELPNPQVYEWTEATEAFIESWKASELDDRYSPGFNFHQIVHPDELVRFPKSWKGREAAVGEALSILCNHHEAHEDVIRLLLEREEINADQVADLIADRRSE